VKRTRRRAAAAPSAELDSGGAPVADEPAPAKRTRKRAAASPSTEAAPARRSRKRAADGSTAAGAEAAAEAAGGAGADGDGRVPDTGWAGVRTGTAADEVPAEATGDGGS
jgi:hypothetical protein